MGRELQPGIDKIPESWVKDRVKKILGQFSSIKVDMPPASMYGDAGRHDFIICQRGHFWTIETKAGYNKPSQLQINYADDVSGAGGSCYLINEFNYLRVNEIAERFDIYDDTFKSWVVASDNFRAYRGGKEYASKTWGTCFSS